MIAFASAPKKRERPGTPSQAVLLLLVLAVVVMAGFIAFAIHDEYDKKQEVFILHAQRVHAEILAEPLIQNGEESTRVIFSVSGPLTSEQERQWKDRIEHWRSRCPAILQGRVEIFAGGSRSVILTFRKK